jgi:hypothetical protein
LPKVWIRCIAWRKLRVRVVLAARLVSALVQFGDRLKILIRQQVKDC